MNKKTVIIGATTNPSRYAYLAAEMLSKYGHEIVPVGIKKGDVSGLRIQDLRSRPEIKDVDTVTLYIGARHQPEWYDYIVSLKPRRVIFNPGTENDELVEKLKVAGLFSIEACTLVMLRSGQY